MAEKVVAKKTAASPATVGPHTVVPPQNVDQTPEGAVLPSFTSSSKVSSAKKTSKKAPRKTSAKNTPAKKAAATRKRNADAARRAAAQQAADRPSGTASVAQTNPEVSRIAREASVRGSRWGSGRERDEMVKALGHDPAAVRAEIHRLHVEKQSGNG